jgi:hypothetical protein
LRFFRLDNALASQQKINKVKGMLRFLSLLSVSLMGYLPSLMACDGCKEPANVAGDSGVAGISAGFSWSVVFMLAMLAFLLTGLVIMMVRTCRQLADQQHHLAPNAGLRTVPKTSRFAFLKLASFASFASPLRRLTGS